MVGTNVGRSQDGSQDNLPGTTSSFRSVVMQDSWWVKACASDFFIWPHTCPHHFRRGSLALKIEQNLGSVPSGLQIPNHGLYLLWLILPSWECFCGSAFVNLLSVGSAGFAIRNWLLVPTLNYFLIQLAFLIGRVLQEPSSHPKWGKEKESPMIPPPAAVISAFILNMLTVWWWCVEPFI